MTTQIFEFRTISHIYVRTSIQRASNVPSRWSTKWDLNRATREWDGAAHCRQWHETYRGTISSPFGSERHWGNDFSKAILASQYHRSTFYLISSRCTPLVFVAYCYSVGTFENHSPTNQHAMSLHCHYFAWSFWIETVHHPNSVPSHVKTFVSGVSGDDALTMAILVHVCPIGMEWQRRYQNATFAKRFTKMNLYWAIWNELSFPFLLFVVSSVALPSNV